VVEKLNSTITEIMSDPEVIERLEAMGATPMASTPEEFATFFENEIEKNAVAVERAGVTVD
jgi:tripartite-type tricarboxylate transporter receptor subunit TctC